MCKLQGVFLIQDCCYENKTQCNNDEMSKKNIGAKKVSDVTKDYDVCTWA